MAQFSTANGYFNLLYIIFKPLKTTDVMKAVWLEFVIVMRFQVIFLPVCKITLKKYASKVNLTRGIIVNTGINIGGHD